MLRHTFLTLILAICLPLSGAEWRQYTSRDGLITREVHQIAELPNGQLLVNCEGVFCLFNGRRFEILPCDRRRVMPLPHFAEGYAHLWQGDSLLWLRDFHKLYLFDTRSRTFRYNWEQRIAAKEIQQLVSGATGAETLPSDVDSVMKVCGFPHPLMATTGLTDRQGGTWVCTREHGIFYMPPRRVRANTVPYVDEEEAFGVHDSQGRQWHTDTEGLICHTAEGIIRYRQAGSAPLPGARNVKEVKGLYHNDMNFITPLPDGRLLLCNMMNVLGYFSPEACTFTCLNERLPAISHHRFLVGACPMAEENRVLVYAQDGAFILDTRADTLCDFPARETIERYADKYNCALQARDKRLWVGTQNGLFVVEDGKAGGATRISGLANDCIRSLVEDEEGDIWVGTSCGISRVGRGVMNLDESDGIPNAPMTERDARRLSDGRLAFRNAWGYTLFHPADFAPEATTLPVVMVGASVCGQQVADGLSAARLPHNQNNLSIQFSALNYAAPAHTHYRHRLRGLTDEWQTASDGDLATVTYYALPPGRYTFEAQAQVDNGEWGEPLQITFRIRPPWWLTWWAKALYALITLGATGALVALYLKRKKARIIAENDERVNRLFELRDEARHRFAENVNINPEALTTITVR